MASSKHNLLEYSPNVELLGLRQSYFWNPAFIGQYYEATMCFLLWNIVAARRTSADKEYGHLPAQMSRYEVLGPFDFVVRAFAPDEALERLRAGLAGVSGGAEVLRVTRTIRHWSVDLADVGHEWQRHLGQRDVVEALEAYFETGQEPDPSLRSGMTDLVESGALLGPTSYGCFESSGLVRAFTVIREVSPSGSHNLRDERLDAYVEELLGRAALNEAIRSLYVVRNDDRAGDRLFIEFLCHNLRELSEVTSLLQTFDSAAVSVDSITHISANSHESPSVLFEGGVLSQAGQVLLSLSGKEKALVAGFMARHLAGESREVVSVWLQRTRRERLEIAQEMGKLQSVYPKLRKLAEHVPNVYGLWRQVESQMAQYLVLRTSPLAIDVILKIHQIFQILRRNIVVSLTEYLDTKDEAKAAQLKEGYESRSEPRRCQFLCDQLISSGLHFRQASVDRLGRALVQIVKNRNKIAHLYERDAPTDTDRVVRSTFKSTVSAAVQAASDTVACFERIRGRGDS